MAQEATLADNGCTFCKISNRIPDGNPKSGAAEEQKTENPPEYFFADDQLFVIKDIHPKTTHHYLVITRQHIESAKSLTRQHADLVRRMVQVGAQVLKDRYKDGNVNLKDIQLGFHWPPMVLVKHLHMHVFYPASEMSFFSRNVIFRPGLLFVTPDWLIEHIQAIPDH